MSSAAFWRSVGKRVGFRIGKFSWILNLACSVRCPKQKTNCLLLHPIWPIDTDVNFTVELENYRGSIELLLFLVRKHELQLEDLPLSVINEQFAAMIELADEIDINSVGDFIDVAGTLIEMKSKSAYMNPEGKNPTVHICWCILTYHATRNDENKLGKQYTFGRVTAKLWSSVWTRRRDIEPRGCVYTFP